jgi:hypothetical protein
MIKVYKAKKGLMVMEYSIHTGTGAVVRVNAITITIGTSGLLSAVVGYRRDQSAVKFSV